MGLEELGTFEEFSALLAEARREVTAYREALPDFGLMISIERQLEFMAECVDSGSPPTDEEAASVNIGLIAVRELDDTDPKLSDMLKVLDYSFKRWDRLENSGTLT
jgi:hypothetical protein